MDALDSDRFGDLVGWLMALRRLPLLQPESELLPCQEVLPRLARRVWKGLRRAKRGVGRSEGPERLHKVRIHAKRARYAAEVMAPGLDENAGEEALAFAAAAAALQDCLGTFRDATVAAERVRAIAATISAGPAFHEATEWLAQRQDEAAQEALASFDDCWDRLDRKSLREWMKG